MSLTNVERARRYLAKCPAAISGQGGHNATFHAAAALVQGFALGEEQAMGLMREWNQGCQPPWSEGDLRHKVRSATHTPQGKPRGYLLGEAGHNERKDAPQGRERTAPLPCDKPVFQPMVLRRIAAKVREIRDIEVFLAEQSPVRPEWQDSASFLRALYGLGSGEKVLVFTEMKSQGQFLWEADRGDRIQNRQLPAGPEGVWFLPQPVTGQFHENPRLGGKRSRRSEEAVTAWRYAVLESDVAAPDEWLRCLVQMPLRIASICESGGRSIHALVRVDAASKADWDAKIKAMKPVLVTLGADPGALSAVRLTRLPQAMRGVRRQKLLYLNPAPAGVPIFAGKPQQEAPT